jgi:hypothetical protein
MMVIGTHNTMTYLEPKNWFMKIFNRFAQCQSKTIEQQFEDGCRYFDLRIRFKHGKMIFAHGLIEYKYDNPIEVIEWLIEKSKKEKIYVRILLETIRTDIKQFNQFNSWYMDYILNSTILEDNPNFKIRIGIKNPWLTEIDKFDIEFKEIAEYINSIKKFLKTPKWFAEHTQDAKLIELQNFNGIVAMDFI